MAGPAERVERKPAVQRSTLDRSVAPLEVSVPRPTGSAHLDVGAQRLWGDVGCCRVITGSPLVERSTEFRVEAHRERTSRAGTHRRTSRPASPGGFRSGRGGLRTPDSLLVRQVL